MTELDELKDRGWQVRKAVHGWIVWKEGSRKTYNFPTDQEFADWTRKELGGLKRG